MPKEKAKNYYLGKGCQKMNCAQSVVAAFKPNSEMLNDFAMYGSGMAPDGWCGAAYSASQLTNNADSVAKIFEEKAGSVKCREIRGNRKLSCVGCVELGAEIAAQQK